MAQPAPAPKKKGSFTTILIFGLMFVVITNQELMETIGDALGFVLTPTVGFNRQFPVVTIMLAGTLMVLLTTAIRHFTTDWLEQAKFQSYMRAFQKEFAAARKENNTYQLKILTEKQPEVMQKQQQVSMAQMKTMPYTMIIIIPLFAWLGAFLRPLEYSWYTAPWNLTVDMFGTTVFPHWILLYMTLSIPLGALVQKTMKFVSWRRRWQPVHPDVHED
jgi:uncharacterized membrane protein (DUF106 family)